MKRHGVSRKLFVITAVFFLLFYAIAMLSQLLLFERFYQYQKTSQIEKRLKSFRDAYAKNRWDADRATREIGHFISQNKAQLAILNPDGKVKHDYLFRITIQDDQGQSVKISLSFVLSSDLKKLLEANLQKGDRIEVKGNYEELGSSNMDIFYPQLIRKPGFSDIGRVQEEPVQSLSGVITDIVLPSADQWNSRQTILFLALEDWFPLTEERKAALLSGGGIQEEWTDPLSGTRSVVMIQPVLREGKASELAFALVNLQQISEAYDALQVFYIYIGIGGIVLILLLSLIFTKIVSKPLVSLNQIALRMAKLDFSVKSPIRSNDEFESLSHSLNSLSERLSDTLKELYDANEQLRSDMEQKQRMEQMQKEFISNASHELKTPLSIVKGYVEGIRDGVGEAKRERYLEVILGETDKMEELIKDMLELAKLESAAIKLKKSPFLLSELVEEIVEKLSKHCSEKGLKVEVVAVGEHEVQADPQKIEQVLVNLLMNAIRHAAPDSEIVVRIENEGVQTRLEIENEGETIPPDQLGIIWERFYRVERSRNRKTGGTGLGLAIVRHILELHESRYGVTNTERGVRFYFYL
ncbi:ATP-binding protein [Paenibacillus filicis]|uniref:histidine kinase n=1 Tax=Paenibacillus filicis TaxID=669464 RepID=A0ABU9DLF6_9BACL